MKCNSLHFNERIYKVLDRFCMLIDTIIHVHPCTTIVQYKGTLSTLKKIYLNKLYKAFC